MSRYPQMSQPAATYDRSLLVGAPALTQADRQAGYDINALEQGSYYVSPSSRYPVADRFASTSAPAPTAANPFADQNQYVPQPSPEPSLASIKPPWYKTTRGRMLIGLGVILFIGLIAGIAAGTASAKQSKNSTLLSDNTNTQVPAQATNSPNTPIATTSSDPTNPNPNPNVGQQPTTITFGSGNNGNNNGNGNGNGATRSTPGSNQGATTIVFGGRTSTQHATITTRGSGNGNSGNDDNIPTYCYIFPELPDCSGYFDNVPKH